MNKADVEQNILEIAEAIYKTDVQYFEKLIENNSEWEKFLSYIRFEFEKILVEAICLAMNIND